MGVCCVGTSKSYVGLARAGVSFVGMCVCVMFATRVNFCTVVFRKCKCLQS